MRERAGERERSMPALARYKTKLLQLNETTFSKSRLTEVVPTYPSVAGRSGL
jgi:hypothetical protein